MKIRYAIASICAILILIIGLRLLRTSIDFTDLSENQLIDAGYYAYVLPKEYVDSLGWKQTIGMLKESFEYHCKEDSNLDRWNPIIVKYWHEENHPLTIHISPNDGLFNKLSDNLTIALDVSWTPAQSGEYYSPAGGTRLLVKDRFGMDVAITSDLAIDQVTELVNRLEYLGPDPDTISNPWSQVCE